MSVNALDIFLLHDRPQGRRCWLDEHQVVAHATMPGEDLHEGIDRGIRLWDEVLLCASKASLRNSWWLDGENQPSFPERGANHERAQSESEIDTSPGPLPGPLPGRGGEGRRKVLALIPLNLDDFLFSAEYQSGKKAEIKSRVAANFVGWERSRAV